MKTNNINYLHAKQRFEVTIIDLIAYSDWFLLNGYGSLNIGYIIWITHNV